MTLHGLGLQIRDAQPHPRARRRPPAQRNLTGPEEVAWRAPRTLLVRDDVQHTSARVTLPEPPSWIARLTKPLRDRASHERNALHPGLAAVIDELSSLIQVQTGLVVTEPRRCDLVSALERTGPDPTVEGRIEYARSILRSGRVPRELLDLIVIGETYFFRHPEQFDFLRAVVLPQLIASRGSRPVRLWSAGCATGEEAWSLAILAHELGLDDRSVEIIGTDICEAHLSAARSAEYRPWALRDSPRQFVDAYFHHTGSKLSLDRSKLPRVRFERLNLMDLDSRRAELALLDIDVVLCRNLLIYFSSEAVLSVSRALAACLAESGRLITGPTDPGLPLSSSLIPREGAGVRFYVRRSPADVLDTAVPASSVVSRSIDQITPIESHLSASRSEPMPRPPETHVASTEPVEMSHLERLRGALLARDYAGALAHIKDWRASRPASASASPETATRCALELVTDMSKEHRMEASLHLLAALLLMELGRRSEAESALRRVVYIQPRNAVAHFLLGQLLVRQGQSDRARVAFRNARENALSMPPDEPVGFDTEGSAAELAESARSALERLDRAGTKPS